MDEFIPLRVVIAEVRRRLEQRPSAVHVIWVTTEGDRDEYGRQLRAEAADLPLVALVVRGVPFADPNCLLQDLATLLERSREEFQGEQAARWAAGGGGVVVLIARAPLGVPLAASPIAVPGWFPVCPGETVFIAIDDISWTATELLSSPAVEMGHMCSLLFELDGVMLERTTYTHATDRRQVLGLFDRIRRQETERIEQFLGDAKAVRSQVLNPSAFRPSAGRADFLIARLWRLTGDTPPNKLTPVASALRDGLHLVDVGHQGGAESFLSVLGRPTSPDASPDVRYARNVLHIIRNACQLSTAVAHADDYPAYPFSLLKSVSLDLRVALNDAVHTIRSLPAF
jgi:hypothetical protein